MTCDDCCVAEIRIRLEVYGTDDPEHCCRYLVESQMKGLACIHPLKSKAGAKTKNKTMTKTKTKTKKNKTKTKKNKTKAKNKHKHKAQEQKSEPGPPRHIFPRSDDGTKTKT
jgi:hypothetical protein